MAELLVKDCYKLQYDHKCNLPSVTTYYCDCIGTCVKEDDEQIC
jgi:hypothetical protein